MLRHLRGYIFLCLSISFCISCSVNDQKKITSASSLVKNFTVFAFGTLKNDTILKCYLKAISFKNDSVIVISTDDNYIYTYSKTWIPERNINLIDSCLTCISIDSLIGSDIIRKSREVGAQYCGYDFGFENLDGKIGVFNPVFFSKDKESCLIKLREYIFSLSGTPTNDTIGLIRPIVSIQAEYLKANPPPKFEMIKFRPPVIVDEPVNDK